MHAAVILVTERLLRSTGFCSGDAVQADDGLPRTGKKIVINGFRTGPHGVLFFIDLELGSLYARIRGLASRVNARGLQT